MLGTTAAKKITIGKFAVNVLATPGDGDCMLHAIARALYPAYNTGVRHGRRITQKQIVTKMRKDLLEKLERRNPENGLRGYDEVSDGAFAATSEVVDTTKLSYLRKILGGSYQLGEEVKVLIEHFIHCNIFLIDARSNQLYSKHDFNPDWNVVVLYHTIYVDAEGTESGHFELVTLDQLPYHRPSGEDEVFSPQHPFVQYLLR